MRRATRHRADLRVRSSSSSAMGCVFAKPDDGSFAGKDSRHMLARPKVRRRVEMGHVPFVRVPRRGCPPAHFSSLDAFARATPPRRHPPDPSPPRAPPPLAPRQCRVLAVIPARFDSERFPGKPLAQVGGKSLVRLTYEAAEGAKCVDYCCVATDDDRVIDAVKSFGGRVVRTSRECADGSERCAQAYRLLVARRAAASRKHRRSDDFDVVVKVECDEAFIRAHHIETAADLVINTDAVVATLVRVSRGPEVRRSARSRLVPLVQPSPPFSFAFGRTHSTRLRFRDGRRDSPLGDARAAAAVFSRFGLTIRDPPPIPLPLTRRTTRTPTR